MAFIINNNLTSEIAKSNLEKVASKLGEASAERGKEFETKWQDDSGAGYTTNTNWEVKMQSLDFNADAVAKSADTMNVLHDGYNNLSQKLVRLKELTEKSADDKVSDEEKNEIENKIRECLSDIESTVSECKINDENLMDGTYNPESVGFSIDGITDGMVVPDASLFQNPNIMGFLDNKETGIDDALDFVKSKIEYIEGTVNNINQVFEKLDIRAENITSSLSTLKDFNVADKSSDEIQEQIIRDYKATLLSTANISPNSIMHLL